MTLLYASQDVIGFQWPQTVWSIADNNARNVGPPAGTDEARFTSNSGACLITGTDVCSTLTIDSDYPNTITFGTDIDVGSGGVDMGGGTLAGTGTLYCAGVAAFGAGVTISPTVTLEMDGVSPSLTTNGARLGPITINVSGTMTMNDDLMCRGLVVTSGTFDPDGGIIIGLSGTVTDVVVSAPDRIIAWGCTDGGGNGDVVEFFPRQMGGISMAA